MFVLLILAAACLLGAVYYDKKITAYKKSGYITEAEVLKKDSVRYKPSPRGSWITRYILNVSYTDKNGISAEGVFSTDNRRAKKINVYDRIEIAVIDCELMLKHDLPTKAGMMFLAVSAAFFFMMFVLGMTAEFV